MGQTRSVLLIAYHFPPVQGSSGVQRTLRFTQHLPDCGWRPVVLTITPGAYEAVAHVAGNEPPPGLEVRRAFGVDAARLSVFGRYPRRFALPDRWASWRWWAVRAALRLVREARIDVVWSTFPIATAHAIGLEVARRTGLPWIAEFRDPMWQGDYPPDPEVNRAWRTLEQRIFAHAAQVVVTTPGAAAVYAERFPDFGAGRIALIENGYDEDTFRRARGVTAAPHAAPIRILHSGVVYPNERDPTALFTALAELKRAGRISAAGLQLTLRGSGFDQHYRPQLDALGIADIVRLEPQIDYLAALEEMLGAHGLLILQAANCNAQVPAKLYEYLRSGRPILALTDPAGDTARTLAAAGTGLIAPLDSAAAIEAELLRFLDEIGRDEWRRPAPGVIARYSRAAQTAELAARLEQVAGHGRQPDA
jgi:glycosyltransferase involved in cell wall biosynthesis